jgi:hypothetical protein
LILKLILTRAVVAIRQDQSNMFLIQHQEQLHLDLIFPYNLKKLKHDTQ